MPKTSPKPLTLKRARTIVREEGENNRWTIPGLHPQLGNAVGLVIRELQTSQDPELEPHYARKGAARLLLAGRFSEIPEAQWAFLQKEEPHTTSVLECAMYRLLKEQWPINIEEWVKFLGVDMVKHTLDQCRIVYHAKLPKVDYNGCSYDYYPQYKQARIELARLIIQQGIAARQKEPTP